MRRKVERRSARPVGAMADRREETAFSYIRILRKAKLIDEETLAPGAWELWLKVNEDRVIVEKKTKLDKIHQRVGYLSRYLETATVLQNMTTVELLSLRLRLLTK